MRTIRAAVGGNQARRGVTLAGPRDGGSAALGQPIRLRAGFGAEEVSRSLCCARAARAGCLTGSQSMEVFRRPPVIRGLQSWGAPRELPPGRTVPADPGCSLPALVNLPVNESSVPGGGREGGGDPKLRTTAGGDSAVGDYRDAGSESWVPKATASNQDLKQRPGDFCGFKNPILAPTPGTRHHACTLTQPKGSAKHNSSQCHALGTPVPCTVPRRSSWALLGQVQAVKLHQDPRE